MENEEGRQPADGGGRAFDRVADALRHRIAQGVYPLRSQLPPQRALADEFAVSRDTVQRVLRELRDEGWIESRQGSGSRVVKARAVRSSTVPAGASPPAVTLGPLISEAFEQPEVDLDVYALTSESLATHIQLQLERIRAGLIRPSRITLRLLLPTASVDLPYLRAADPKDTPRLRQRLVDLTLRHVESSWRTLRELRAEGLVSVAEFSVRSVPIAPTWKLYLINGVEALHGLYVPVRRPVVLDSGEEIPALDVLGLGAPLTRFVRDADPNSRGSLFVEGAQGWFDATWDQLGLEQDWSSVR
ncbi:winged helix-turn-helix domain-containing protein [Streptomyces sp. NPDC047042]|uniref:winged helix-turn-helix domain-containing protein n=1 Tax=Streptomyces sp. NPDC047042 TaxID=3154807 RepID=UPI0034048FF7